MCEHTDSVDSFRLSTASYDNTLFDFNAIKYDNKNSDVMLHYCLLENE